MSKKKLKKKIEELDKLIKEVLEQKKTGDVDHNYDRQLRSLRSRKGHTRRKLNETERLDESPGTDGENE